MCVQLWATTLRSVMRSHTLKDPLSGLSTIHAALA
jgi:hypothetical protein